MIVNPLSELFSDLSVDVSEGLELPIVNIEGTTNGRWSQENIGEGLFLTEVRFLMRSHLLYDFLRLMEGMR